MNFFKKGLIFEFWARSPLAKCSSETQKFECQFAMVTLNFAWRNSQEPEVFFSILICFEFIPF